jgi:7,8-dihydropterin-6-yl-methyl-4-(beta-D-ribofuranosyl)aminobenzene 5'-phosphate synthase
MHRRDLLKLGAVAGATFAVGGMARAWRSTASAQPAGIPTVDRLVMTVAVDNVYDIFAKGGKLDTITVERAPFARSGNTLLAEHGLAYHLESFRGSERREILLDFALTDGAITHNYRALKLDPARADALILSHGHADHYGALTSLVDQGAIKPGKPASGRRLRPRGRARRPGGRRGARTDLPVASSRAEGARSAASAVGPSSTGDPCAQS